MSRILVIGAGVAGSSAAHELMAAGHDVVVVDKGHVPGGRVATRTVAGAVFDIGAQFLTARSGDFRARVDAWVHKGVAAIWFHGSPDAATDPTGEDPDQTDGSGHPRFRGSPTMRHLAAHVAAGLPLRLGTVIERVETTGTGWRLHGTSRRGDRIVPLEGDALVMTAPVPQILTLLEAGSVPLSGAHRAELDGVSYDPCLTLLAIPRGLHTVPRRGAVRLDDEAIAWVTDNQASGASPVPALTIHATAEFSREHFDAPRDGVGREIAALARPLLGTDVEVAHVHGWRFAAPRATTPETSLLDTSSGPPLVVAGDALAGGRVEGAFRSGHDAATRLLTHLDAQA